MILQRAQFLQRAAAVELFPCKLDAFPQILGQTRNNKSAGRVDDRHIAFRAGDRAGKNSFNRGRIFARVAAEKFRNPGAWNSEPAHVQNRGRNFVLVELRNCRNAADRG